MFTARNLDPRWLAATSWLLSAGVFVTEAFGPRFEITSDQVLLRFLLVIVSISLSLVTTALVFRVAIDLLLLCGIAAFAAAVFAPGRSHNWDSLRLGCSIAAAALVTTLWGVAKLRKLPDSRASLTRYLIAMQPILLLVLLLNVYPRG